MFNFPSDEKPRAKHQFAMIFMLDVMISHVVHCEIGSTQPVDENCSPVRPIFNVGSVDLTVRVSDGLKHAAS